MKKNNFSIKTYFLNALFKNVTKNDTQKIALESKHSLFNSNFNTLKCRLKKTKQLLMFWLTLPNRLTLKLTPQAFGDGSVMREVTLSRRKPITHRTHNTRTRRTQKHPVPPCCLVRFTNTLGSSTNGSDLGQQTLRAWGDPKGPPRLRPCATVTTAMGTTSSKRHPLQSSLVCGLHGVFLLENLILSQPTSTIRVNPSVTLL